MASPLTFTKSGAKATTPAKLDKSVFGVDIGHHRLLKSAYDAYLANGRANLAVTKKRGQVRGGGKKPWRQKGTGRARFGSSRNPIWRGGGVAFGPTGQENYSKLMNKSAKRQAVRQALTLAANDGKIIIIEDIKASKTAGLAKLVAKIGADRAVLLIVSDKTAELTRASRNLPGVKLVGAKNLNVFDVINADKLVLTRAALEQTTQWLSPASKVSQKVMAGTAK